MQIRIGTILQSVTAAQCGLLYFLMQTCGFCIAKPGKQNCETVLQRGQVVAYSRFSGYTSFRSTKGDPAETDSVSYDYNNGTMNAWDSPFDFIWKMAKQKEAIVSHFQTKIKTSEESKKTGVFPAAGTTEIAGNGVTNKTLSERPYTQAPDTRWKFYRKASESGNSPFIPGLGFWTEYKNITCTVE